MLQQAFFGPLKEPHHDDHHAEDVPDLNAREVLTIAPLAAMCLYLGLFPQTLIDLVAPDVEGVTRLYFKPTAAVASVSPEAVPTPPASPDETLP
jgi:NADH-quinone oxidoreductase subunit M